MPVSFVIHGEPRGKGRPRIGVVRGHARAFTDQKTRDYEDQVRAAAQAVMANQDQLEGAVWVRINVFMRIPASASKKKQAAMRDGAIRPCKTPDLDNVAKAILDGINGVVFKDDKQVCGIGCTKFYSDHPRVDVTVGPIVL